MPHPGDEKTERSSPALSPGPGITVSDALGSALYFAAIALYCWRLQTLWSHRYVESRVLASLVRSWRELGVALSKGDARERWSHSHKAAKDGRNARRLVKNLGRTPIGTPWPASAYTRRQAARAKASLDWLTAQMVTSEPTTLIAARADTGRAIIRLSEGCWQQIGDLPHADEPLIWRPNLQREVTWFLRLLVVAVLPFLVAYIL